jgi:ferritin-like protein
MDLNQDEVRRQLKAVDAQHRTVMPKWRDALHRMLHGETDLTTDEKAAVLGVPSPGRRQLFKFGGAAVLGAAVLAACGSDDKNKASGTTTTAAGGSGGGSMDLPLARTAASLEQLAVTTYDTAAKSGLVKTSAIASAATLFHDHHLAHRDALNSAIGSLGGQPVTEQNAAVYDALVKPALGKAKTEADVVALALSLELAAAQTYAFAGGALSTPALRSTIMTIGGIEARHAAILTMSAQGKSPFEVFPSNRAFFPGDNPLSGIKGAVLSA